jgi:outer membrane protein W
MKKMFSKRIYSLFILCFIAGLSAQGIQRSNSFGLRVSFWNILGESTVIQTQNNSEQVDIKLGGAGAYLCFTSRAFENIFFELQMGGISGVEVYDDKMSDSSDVYVETMIPFLFGLRYDYLGSRLRGSIHPFISLGVGPYWVNKVKSIREFDETQKTEVKNDFLYGGYFGTGMNIVVSSRFALNFDVRYQFIEFDTGNDYSGPEFIFGFNYMWGKKKEVFEIKDIKLIVKDIYPAYYQFYNLYPIALVSVKNKISKPIDVRVISKIRGSRTKSLEGEFFQINGGETADIPVKAVFSRALQSVSQRDNTLLDFYLEVRAITTIMKEISTPIIVHSRNAWNGDIDKLKYFITPEDNIIRQYSRNIIFNSFKENEPVSDFDRASSGS